MSYGKWHGLIRRISKKAKTNGKLKLGPSLEGWAFSHGMSPNNFGPESPNFLPRWIPKAQKHYLFIYLFFIYIKPILNGTGLQVHDLLPYERPKCPYYTCIRFGIPGIKSRTSLTTKNVLWETIVPFKKALRPPSWLGPCPSTNPRKDQGNPTQPIKEGGSKTKEKRKEQGKVNQLLGLLQAN